MKIFNLMPNQTRSSFLTLSLIITLLTGCQSYSAFDTSDQLVKVTPTQLSKYWVVKDKAIDWTPIYTKKPDLQRVTISFEINPEGDMVNLIIDELEDNLDIHDAMLTQLSEQKFRPTTENINTQSVLVNATILPN